jgi:multiple sugar transport system substrate-binding protein
MSDSGIKKLVSRRNFIKTTGAVALSTGLGQQFSGHAHATKRKTLKILQWNHFVPAFDDWFNKVFIKQWGEKNNTEVLVTNTAMTSIEGRAASEIARKQGHDLCMFLSPPASYEDFVVDTRDVYAECERRYGKPLEIATRSTYNPITKKYFGFSDSYVPDPVNYRKDLWDEVGIVPSSWDAIREGGRKIKQKHGIPLGFGMSNELDSSMALRSLLAAFGASEQTTDGRPSLKSRQSLEALKYAKALYQESMTDEIFSWDASSNNRQMLAGKGSLTLNAISITRTGESEKISLANKIALAIPARGPAAQLGVMTARNSSWST